MDVQDLGSAADQGKQQQMQQAQKPDGASAAPGGESVQKPTRPDWLPENYFDAEAGQIKLDDFGKHYGELAGAAKAEADRIANYPQKPEDLKFTIPADLKLPEGVTFDEKNPQFTAFRQFVFDNKVDPALGNEFLGMYARQMVGETNAINERVQQEIQNLGSNGAARVTALRQFWTGIVGEKLAGQMMSQVFTSDVIGAHEKIMLALGNQNTRTPPGGGRDDGADDGAPKPLENRLFPNMK